MEESDANEDGAVDSEDNIDGTGFKKVPGMQYEPRSFMFCNFLNHPGLA